MSRLVGLVIVLVILVIYAAGLRRDASVTLALLGLATALIGIPAGWSIVKHD